MTLAEKLELFEASAIEEANHQSSLALADYRQTLEKMYQSRIQQAKIEADSFIITETDRIRREHNRALSMEQNKIKRDLGEKHYQVKEKIFADVMTKLEHYKKTDDYADSLVHCIKQIKCFVRGQKVTIYADPTDAHLIPRLEQETGMRITVSAIDFIGGIRAVVPDKNILMDYSYASRLEEEKNNFTI